MHKVLFIKGAFSHCIIPKTLFNKNNYLQRDCNTHPFQKDHGRISEIDGQIFKNGISEIEILTMTVEC